MKRKEILEKAIAEYPDGTKYYSGNEILESNGEFEFFDNKDLFDKYTAGMVYNSKTKQWAEKVKEEKPEEVTLFENSNAQIVVSKGKILIKSEFCSICIAPEALELVLKTYKEINN